MIEQAAGAAINKAQEGKRNQTIGQALASLNDGKGYVQGLIQEGISQPAGSRANQIATGLREKIQSGKTVTDREAGRLYEALEEQKSTSPGEPRAAEVQQEKPDDANVQRSEAVQDYIKLLRETEKVQTSDPRLTELVNKHDGIPDDVNELIRNGDIVIDEDGNLSLGEKLRGEMQEPGVSQSLRESSTPGKSRDAEVQQGEADIKERSRENRAEMREISRVLGKNGRTLVTEFYDGTQRPDAYYKGFSAYYQAGMAGADVDGVQSPYASLLTERQQGQAYQAGRQDAKTSLKQESKNNYPQGWGRKAGLYGSSEQLSQAQAARLEDVAKRTGTRIEIVEGMGQDGLYDPETGTIRISKDAKNPILEVAAHELSHRIQDLAPEQWREYRDYAVRQLLQQSGEALDTSAAVDRKIGEYRENGINLNTQEAMDELAAEYTRKLLEGEDLFKSLAENKPSLARRVLEALKSFLQRLRGKSQTQKNQKAIEVWGADADVLQEAARRWESALQKATERAGEVGNTMTNALLGEQEEEKVKYSTGKNSSDSLESLARENKRLREQVDYLKGQTKTSVPGTVRQEAVKATAKEILKEYKSTVPVQEITAELSALYNLMGTGEQDGVELTYETARELADKISKRIVQNALERNDETYRHYEDLRKLVRGTKLLVTQDMMGDLEHLGGWNEFRKRNMGRLLLSSKEGTAVDTFFGELSEGYKEFFNETERQNPADQLIRIAEAMDAIYTIQEYNPFSRNLDEAAAVLTNDILDRFWSIPEMKTFADVQRAKQEEIRARGAQEKQQAVAEVMAPYPS